MLLSARISAIMLVLACSAPAANAFGLNFGPLHLELPVPGSSQRSHASPSEPTTSGAAQISRPSLLYPVLAWPSLYDNIFWANSSSWPFDYRSIFGQAFAKYPTDRAAIVCPYLDTTSKITIGLARETSPSAAQKLLLQKLSSALGQANGYLMKSCPNGLPSQPVARLQLMEGQIDAVIMALEIVRPPLQKFEQSLDDRQRARWEQTGAANRDAGAACDAKPEMARWPLAQFEQAVQPDDAQRQAVADVEEAFDRAASDLDGGCGGSPPNSATARLEAIESRLDATWRAVQTIQVALENFQSHLSDQQNVQFNELQIAGKP